MNKNIEINGNMDLGAYSPLELTEKDVNESLKEKAVSKAQQRFFGMVDAYKKGEMSDASQAIKKAADGMTKKQVKDFAKTKHKGLPNHVDESTLRKIIKNVLKEVYEVDDYEPADDNDDENYIGSAQYIFDLYVNGNKTQAALEMARAPKSKLIDVFRIAREAGDEEGIQQLYAYTDTDKFKFSQDLDDEHISNAALKSYCSKNFNLQEELNELSNDTIDNAYMKVMNDVNTLPYGTPERVRRDAQLKNMKKLRNDKLGFDPVDMSMKMRQQGTSGNPSIDRKWATWQKNHDDRISGRRTYNDKTGRWITRLTENDLRKIIQETVQTNLVNILGKYTQGKTSSKEANKAIMDLANSSNEKVTNESKSEKYVLYADTSLSKNSDFISYTNEGIEKKDIKYVLRYLPEESITDDGDTVSYDDIQKKGDICLEKDGYVVVWKSDNKQDIYVYKKKEKLNERNNR